jgi:hypothetical protein
VFGIIGAHNDIGELFRRHLGRVPVVRGQRPPVVRVDAPAQRRRRHEQVDGDVEGQAGAQQQRAVQEQHPAGRQRDGPAAGGPVGARVPEVGQHEARAALVQRGQYFPGQCGQVEPVLVERVRVGPPLLEPHRRRPQEPVGGHGQCRVAAYPQRVDQRGRQPVGAGRRRAVDADPQVSARLVVEAGNEQVSELFGESVGADGTEPHGSHRAPPPPFG